MDFAPSEQASALRSRVRGFIADRVMPVEEALAQTRCHDTDWTTWTVAPEIEALKAEARAAGLWNLFLPEVSGLSNVEYAPVAEEMGHSFFAAEIMNCNAPDSGNMEVLHRYGSAEQQARWLAPLLAGEIRSAFCMTEPDVASSDATNMEASATLDGDDVVLTGKKWWSTGIGHPSCKIVIFMGVTDAAAHRHARHSMVLVPLPTPGVTVKRMLRVFGEVDAPFGHGEIWFDGARVPRANIIAGAGRGFEIAQGRLGPGRIHHCMRCIGAAERALGLMIRRGLARTAFGKPLINLGGNRERIADLRMAIDQARLLTLYAAWKLDAVGPFAALAEISAIKVVAPNVLQAVADEAIQMYGGAGVSDDTPLAAIFAMARVLRLADGPDAVHRGLIARLELAKHGAKSA